MKADRTSLVRLQKFLSDAGVASRRHAEAMVLEGRVVINGVLVTELPVFVDPSKDRVVADGRTVALAAQRYFIVHKPKGVLCTNSDPSGRMRAVDLLPPGNEHLFPVGRLDSESSGLLLMTNDGELAQAMTHPRFGISKVYQADVKGRTPQEIVAKLRDGVYLSEGKARATGVRVAHAGDRTSVLIITLQESRNRQVQRMLAKLGYPVKELKRLQVGPLTMRELPIGACRELTPHELRTLRAAVEESVANAGPAPRPLRARRSEGSRRDRAQQRVRGGSGESSGKKDRRPRRAAAERPTRRIIT